MSGKRKLTDATAETRKTLRAYPNCDVAGVDVNRVSSKELIDYLCDRAANTGNQNEIQKTQSAFFITYLNAACSNIAANDIDYRGILASSDLVYADGKAIVWASQFLGDPLPERVNAGDFIVDFCRVAAERELPIALVGGRPEVAYRAAEAWKAQAPELKIAGVWSGFFEDNGDMVAEQISRSGAKILLVGMGVPLQEKWAWARREQLGVQVIWCVGALFEYYGEDRARAPMWMRRAGLEWLFRLALEPRRLWRRYLIGNVRFIARILRARFTRRS